MKRYIVFGATNYSFMVSKFIEQEGVAEVIAHTVDRKDVQKYKVACTSRGVKLIPFEELKIGRDVEIINAVGYTKMNSVRDYVSQKIIAAGLQIGSYFSTRATILSEKLSGMGVGNIICPNAYIGTNVTFGSNNVVYAGAILTHDIKMGNNNFIAASCTIGGFVDIGSNCFLGMSSTIKNRIRISNKTLVGAGAYVSESTGIGDVVVPAQSVTLDRKSDSFL